MAAVLVGQIENLVNTNQAWYPACQGSYRQCEINELNERIGLKDWSVVSCQLSVVVGPLAMVFAIGK
jgi:hypothetical protein